MVFVPNHLKKMRTGYVVIYAQSGTTENVLDWRMKNGLWSQMQQHCIHVQCVSASLSENHLLTCHMKIIFIPFIISKDTRECSSTLLSGYYVISYHTLFRIVSFFLIPGC